MTELPAGIAATPSEIEEAAEIVSLISGPEDSVASALARDLATAIGHGPVLITFDDAVGEAAASHWANVLGAAGLEASAGEYPLFAKPVRIHLHSGSSARAGYAGIAADDSAGVLVGEVIGQGHSAAARFCSLVAVAEALAADLGSTRPEPTV